MKAKKILSLLLAGTMVLGTLAGCGAKEEKAEGGKIENPEEISAELTLWDASWNENITPGLIDKFNEEYPNIKVNVEFFPIDGMTDKYLTALTGGSSADLLSINNEWVSTYATAEGLLNLDKYIDENNFDMSDFYDGAQTGVTVNDSVYALPYRAETHGMFYNVDLFKKAGYEEMPETWEEFLPIAQKITEQSGGAAKGIAIPGGEWGNTSYQLTNMILCSGGSILNEDNTKCTLDSEEAIKAANFFVDLYQKHGVVPESIMENDNAAGRVLFSEGKVASFMSGAYDIAALEELNSNLNMGTSLLPTFEGAERKTIFAGWSTAISANTKNPDAAWLLAEFLASPEISVEYSTTFSARKSMETNEKYVSDPLLKNLAEAVKYGEPLPVIPQISQIRQIMYEQIQLALSGEITAEEAMKTSTEQINEIL
ncbi:MAG: extracellular solute-binding protein [Hespellia sp.]|nr:extracellular solute-binding protein [Hespellia sp.]